MPAPRASVDSPPRAQGKADLLFERGGEWRVVEFKTDRLDGPDSV
jgi:ATP-dependent exoDNAse (exonuclease V) beta subunit